MLAIKPLNDYVLVELAKQENKSMSGIITAPSLKETPGKWKVLKLWEWRKTPDGKLITIDNIKEWDIVYFTKYSPEEIEIDNNKYLLIKVDSIIAKEE